MRLAESSEMEGVAPEEIPEVVEMTESSERGVAAVSAMTSVSWES